MQGSAGRCRAMHGRYWPLLDLFAFFLPFFWAILGVFLAPFDPFCSFCQIGKEGQERLSAQIPRPFFDYFSPLLASFPIFSNFRPLSPCGLFSAFWGHFKAFFGFFFCDLSPILTILDHVVPLFGVWDLASGCGNVGMRVLEWMGDDGMRELEWDAEYWHCSGCVGCGLWSGLKVRA